MHLKMSHCLQATVGRQTTAAMMSKEQQRRQEREFEREQDLKDMKKLEMHWANLKSEERADEKRYLRMCHQEEMERDMQESLVKVRVQQLRVCHTVSVQELCNYKNSYPLSGCSK